MTLQPYTPDRLDELTLRIVDVASRLRRMAERARGQEVNEFHIHDKKALEWLERLEEWSQKSETDLDLALLRERGVRRAGEVAGK